MPNYMVGCTPVSGQLSTLHCMQSDKPPTCCIKLRKHRHAILDAGNPPLLCEQELRGRRQYLAGS